MPSNIVLRNLTTPPKKASNPLISTKSGLRGGARATEQNPAVNFTAELGFALLNNGDGTMTITDSQSRFGIKPNAAKPVWFFDFGFGSDQPHPTLSRQQKLITWRSQCVPNQIVAKAGSTHSMTIDAEAADKGGTVFGGVEADLRADKTLQLPANSGRKYYRYYDYYNDFLYTELQDSVQANAGSSFENFKTNRWQSEGAQTTPYTSGIFQGTNHLSGFFSADAGEYFKSNGFFTEKRWTVEEEYLQNQSAQNVGDAVMYGVVNGELKFTLANQLSHGTFDPALHPYDHYKLGNFDRWALPGVAPFRANILYVDDSWCRIYITDKPTWNNTEVKAMELQVPVGWVSGQIDFHQRTGALGDLAGKYLWVADNNDTKILVGGW